ncbi:MAG: CaiB/BaiF CoA transferase family protein, partial [Ktedonobacterales bacterium]
DSRHWGPPFKAGESAYFMSCNRNKRGITLNLKTDGGREALWRLIERADVLVENFRPGLLARLGFSYEAVSARNPRLIYCSISGFGQEGPEAQKPGYDIILQGMSGVASITGDPDGRPVRAGLPICDILAGLFAQQGILAALYAREHTGRGQRVETTLLGATVAALGNFAGSYLMSGKVPQRVGNSHPQIAPYDLLRTADGYTYVAGGNDDIWQRFCRALDLPALLDDPRFATNGERVRHREAMLQAVEARTSQISTNDLLALLEEAKVPAGPIRHMAQVFDSPQAQYSGLAQTMQHPIVGEFRTVNTALAFSETPATLRLPPPTLGQHTDEVLCELGYADEVIVQWHEEGAV